LKFSTDHVIPTERIGADAGAEGLPARWHAIPRLRNAAAAALPRSG